MAKASSPVRFGDGREVGDLQAHMRKLMLDCQQSLQTLLKQDDDLKLKLATIKLILDYGWGRPRPMNAPPEPTKESYQLTAIMAADYHAFLEQLTDGSDADYANTDDGCGEQPQSDCSTGETRMALVGPEQPKDAEG